MRPNLILISLAGLASAGMINSAFADGAAIAQHGTDHGTPACASCHGAHGEGLAASGFPRLAGMNAGYLQTQLVALAKGQRVNPVMSPIAKSLSAEERAAVAGYYAGLPAPATGGSAAPHPNPAGERLALQGRWAQGLPACIQCHGATGAGVGATFPALAGQSSIYIENQLHAWQQGARAPGPLGLMKVVASKLSATDIHDVAAYFASLPVSTADRRNKP